MVILLLKQSESTRIISSTPATSTARRSTVEVATATTGLSLRTIATTRTTCTSAVATSARPATTVSTTDLASAA